MRLFAAASILSVLSACAGCRNYGDFIAEDPLAGTVEWFCSEKRDHTCVVAVDASDDRRMFRIASLTKLMLYPMLERLESEGRLDLDWRLTECFRDPLPEEYRGLTLRDLLESRSGLPREFIDPWCLGDVWTAFHCGFAGIDIYGDFSERADFVRKLHEPAVRGDVKRRIRRYSNMGFALMMMAVCDRLGESVEALFERYVVRPYGLEDTFFEVPPERLSGLTPACSGALPWLIPRGKPVPDHRLKEVAKLTGGLRSSASDMLKVFNSLWGRIEALDVSGAEDGDEVWMLKVAVLRSGRKILYRHGIIYGGATFVGFDVDERRIVLVMRNVTSWPSGECVQLVERLAKEGRMRHAGR
jgi:CubicO group peptidase (beta-lactamase class C family)